MKTYDMSTSYRMFEEAKRIVPNGIYGPRSPHFLTYGSYPCFFTHGKGSHVWDVDGNEYIDYMCSFGTNVLGMNHKEVDDAALEQQRRGDSFTLPTDRWNILAETMVAQIEGMDWVAFGKNGSDVTTYSTSIARQYTGRKMIITVRGAYNGSHFWCSHGKAGVPDEYRAHVTDFAFNDLDEFTSIVKKNPGNVAAVMLTPHHHPAMADQVLPAEGFYRELEAFCRREGVLIIMDDIRCGFRMHEKGTHVLYGIDPDIVCFGKAMANGYPIAAVMGKAAVKQAAEAVFFSGTHFFTAVPMAAAVAAIGVINRDNVPDKLRQLGDLLKNGLLSQAERKGLKVVYTGPPAMPFMRFEGDDDYSVNRLFCGEAARRGIFLHPHHNWFVCMGHTAKDIERTLEVTDECFELVKKGK